MVKITDLSYFTGRTVEDLVQGKDSWDWGIQLNGGGIIRNKDEDREAPDLEKLRGQVFLRPIFSELDTRLQFGQGDQVAEEVVLTPTLYTISDPIYAPEGEIYPQAVKDMDDMLPEDPSKDRVAIGPEEAGEGESEIPTEGDEK